MYEPLRIVPAVGSRYGALLAVLTFLGTPVQLFAQPEELKLVAEFRGHEADIWRMCISGDGKTLVTSSYDGTCRFWTVPELKEPFPVVVKSENDDKSIIRGTLPKHGPFIGMLPDGKTMLVADTLRPISSGNEARSRLRLVDVATRTEVNPPKEPHELKVGHFLELSPDGKILLALGSRDLVAGERDQTRLELWDREAGKLLGTLSGRRPRHGLTPAFSPDSKLLAMVSGDSTNEIKVWDVKSRTVTVTITPTPVNYGNGLVLSGAPRGVAFTPDSRMVAAACSGNSTIQIFDSESGDGVRLIRFGESRATEIVTFSADGRYFASAGRSIWVWDIKASQAVAKAQAMRCTIAAFSPSGKHLAVVCEDKTFAVKLFAIPNSK